MYYSSSACLFNTVFSKIKANLTLAKVINKRERRNFEKYYKWSWKICFERISIKL